MKLTKIYLILISALLLVNACAFNKHCKKENDNLKEILMTEFTKKGWDLEIGCNINDIKRMLGEPVSEVIKNKSNLHDEEQIRIKFTRSNILGWKSRYTT